MLTLIAVAIVLHIIASFKFVDYTIVGNGVYSKIVCHTLRSIGKKVKFIPYDNKIKKYIVDGGSEFFDDFDITNNSSSFYVPLNNLNNDEIKLLEKHTRKKNLDKWQKYILNTLYNFNGTPSIDICSLPTHDNYYCSGMSMDFGKFIIMSSAISTWKTKRIILCSTELMPNDTIVSYHISKNYKQYSLENYIVDTYGGVHKLFDTADRKSPVFSLKTPRYFTDKIIHPFYLPPSTDPVLSMIITVLSCYY